MSKTVLLVGTRKGCFLLEGDEARRDWQLRGPFCEGWPIYHAIYEPEAGMIYAAAASEWHGASVWRSPDLGETWEQSSEGLNYADSGLKLSKVSGLTATNGRLFAGAEMPGVFESRDHGQTWTLYTTLEGHPDRESWNDPANQPPGHLGVPAILPHPDDAAQRGPARGLAARVRGRRFLRPQARPVSAGQRSPVPAEPRRDAPQRRRRQDVDRDHRRPADRVRLRGRRPPARSRHVLRHPARRRTRARDAGGQGSRLADARRRLELAAARRRPAPAGRARRRVA